MPPCRPKVTVVFLQHEAPLGHHTRIPGQLHLARPMRCQQKLMSCSQQLKRFLAAMSLNVNAIKPNYIIYLYSSRGTFHIKIIILYAISLSCSWNHWSQQKIYLEVRVLKAYYIRTYIVHYSCEIYIRNVYRNKPSDEVVTIVLAFDPLTPAEVSHLTLKEYRFPGLKSVTVSEVAVSTVNSFPLFEWYVTMYLNGLLHPLSVSLTDWAVLPSIDTLSPDGAVYENVKCNNKPKVVKAISMQLMATSVIESARHTCWQCSVVLPRAPVSTFSTTSHSSNPKSILSISWESAHLVVCSTGSCTIGHTIVSHFVAMVCWWIPCPSNWWRSGMHCCYILRSWWCYKKRKY